MHSQRLILASNSPRRKQLLEEAGYTFEVIAPHPLAECGVCSGETPPELVARLAHQKAADVAGRVDAEAVILASDTVAALDGQIFGKPENEEHARSILRRLRGREHYVYTGVCLWPVPQGEPLVRVDKTTLKMHDLSDAEIEEYLATGLWEGKAGAFGYQDRVGWLDIVEGSESNVVGLPMPLLAQMLGELQSRSS